MAAEGTRIDAMMPTDTDNTIVTQSMRRDASSASTLSSRERFR